MNEYKRDWLALAALVGMFVLPILAACLSNI